eukprot:1301498-Amphidinium_carterae.1
MASRNKDTRLNTSLLLVMLARLEYHPDLPGIAQHWKTSKLWKIGRPLGFLRSYFLMDECLDD